MVELETWKRLDFGFDRGKDVMQRAAERCSMVSRNGAVVMDSLLMNPTLRPGCSCRTPSSIFPVSFEGSLRVASWNIQSMVCTRALHASARRDPVPSHVDEVE